jgi:hypothetical protein
MDTAAGCALERYAYALRRLIEVVEDERSPASTLRAAHAAAAEALSTVEEIDATDAEVRGLALRASRLNALAVDAVARAARGLEVDRRRARDARARLGPRSVDSGAGSVCDLAG